MDTFLSIPSEKDTIFLYGPPGSGKSSAGPILAELLGLPFVDLDQYIEIKYARTIPEMFKEEGESAFRIKELAAFSECVQKGGSVIALGGGALLDPELRKWACAIGNVICLNASFDTLWRRLQSSSAIRPLIINPDNTQESMLLKLLENRKDHYESFQNRIDTTHLSKNDVAAQAQIHSGMFHIRGMDSDYDVRVKSDSLHQLGDKMIRRKLQGPVAVVCDQAVAKLYLEPVMESLKKNNLSAKATIIPAGEINKTIETVIQLWNSFISAGIDRAGTIVALGGGVVNDLTGFAAATYLRGVKWVAIPTTLLSMVDASLGGKTGADLPAGKNLIGAFHAPSLVVVDPAVLKTLPKEEYISGLAEVIKHAIIADPHLFTICQAGMTAIQEDLENVVKKAIAVKVGVIQEDPYEKGKRAVLNLGHTLGHAIEKVTDYQIRHGEAVAIGMVAAAKVSELSGIGEQGIFDKIRNVLSINFLPTALPEGIDKGNLIEAMLFDKKRRAGALRLVLPKCIGEVIWGVAFSDLSLLTDL